MSVPLIVPEIYSFGSPEPLISPSKNVGEFILISITCSVSPRFSSIIVIIKVSLPEKSCSGIYNHTAELSVCEEIEAVPF